jgi:hypothetical protein
MLTKEIALEEEGERAVMIFVWHTQEKVLYGTCETRI